MYFNYFLHLRKIIIFPPELKTLGKKLGVADAQMPQNIHVWLRKVSNVRGTGAEINRFWFHFSIATPFVFLVFPSSRVSVLLFALSAGIWGSIGLNSVILHFSLALLQYSLFTIYRGTIQWIINNSLLSLVCTISDFYLCYLFFYLYVWWPKSKLHLFFFTTRIQKPIPK